MEIKQEGRLGYSKQSENEEIVCKKEKDGVVAPSISGIFKIRLKAGDDMLERFRLEAE